MLDFFYQSGSIEVFYEVTRLGRLPKPRYPHLANGRIHHSDDAFSQESLYTILVGLVRVLIPPYDSRVPANGFNRESTTTAP